MVFLKIKNNALKIYQGYFNTAIIDIKNIEKYLMAGVLFNLC
jgi:hypothetical protein